MMIRLPAAIGVSALILPGSVLSDCANRGGNRGAPAAAAS
jgi:hypothetical protein